MRQLVGMDCSALVRISQHVQRWNAMLLQDLCAMCGMSHYPSTHPAAADEDDLAFWQTAIQVSLRLFRIVVYVRGGSTVRDGRTL